MARLFADITPVRESRQFRLLFIGMTFSDNGRQIITVAIPLQVYLLTGSTLQVGLVSLLQVVPHMIGSMVGGVAADAMDRRRLLLTVQYLVAAMTVLLALNAMQEQPPVWPLYVLAVLVAGFHGADGPARNAIVPRVVERRQLPAAYAIVQLMKQSAVVVGPAAGGLIIAGFGLAAAYWLTAVLFVATGLAVARMEPFPPTNGGRRMSLGSLTEGFAYLRGRRLLVTNLLVDLIAMVFVMPRALFPEIGLDLLGGNEATVGYLHAAPGVGAMLGAATSGWVGSVRRQGRAVVLSAVAWTFAMVSIVLTRNLVVVLVALAIAGGANVVSAVMRSTILQISITDEVRGRLSAVHYAFTGGGPRLGEAHAGILAGLTNVPFAVVAGGVACLLAMGVLVRRVPEYWLLDAASHDVEPQAPGDTDARGEP